MMAFTSNTFIVRSTTSAEARTTKTELKRRHKVAMDKVVTDAQALAEERRRMLDKITDNTLRVSAAR